MKHGIHQVLNLAMLCYFNRERPANAIGVGRASSLLLSEPFAICPANSLQSLSLPMNTDLDIDELVYVLQEFAMYSRWKKWDRFLTQNMYLANEHSMIFVR